ncbi:MAG: hypothetical protein JOZ57_03760 [Abitibacteriaceae bacterium]|nr:hypothetical protein [Abditibacteriaceae bacterium]
MTGSWRMKGAKDQARAWLRDAGEQVHVAHLISATPEYDPPTHEPPRDDNLIAFGDVEPYNGRLRELEGASYRLLAGFQSKGALALSCAVGGDWLTENISPEEFVELAVRLKESGEIDGVALAFLRYGWPTHEEGSYSDWYGAMPLGIGQLRALVK